LPFDVLELALKAISDEKQDFCFVQIGANDGVMNGSLNPLIRKYGLRGCGAEGLENPHRSLPNRDVRVLNG
jgi:hypothetical protein